MAQCKNCKKEVGCSCSLRNGLCGSCQGTNSFTAPVQPQNPVIHPQVRPQQGNRINPKPIYKPPVVNRATWTK